MQKIARYRRFFLSHDAVWLSEKQGLNSSREKDEGRRDDLHVDGQWINNNQRFTAIHFHEMILSISWPHPAQY